MSTDTPLPGTWAADRERITVVVVTFESAHCVPELGKHLAHFPHVVVVDNASADDTLAAVARHLPQARVVPNQRNLGFGAANNRGLALAQTEFVLLLNPDCSMTPQAAAALLAAADRYPGAAAMGPQLLDAQGQRDLSYRLRLDRWAARGQPAEGDLSVEFLSGACMLIRSEAMRHVRGFDEDFFLYQEDHDLSLRLSAQCGELVLCPQATATHLSRRSSSGKRRHRAEYLRGYHHIQSKFLFEQKHGARRMPVWRQRTYGALAMLEALLRAILLDMGRAARAWGRMAGAWGYVQREDKQEASKRQ